MSDVIKWVAQAPLLIIASPLLLINKAKDAHRKRKMDRLWKSLPQRANGTVVTGVLSESEKVKVIFDNKQGNERTCQVLEAVPLEIWTEIIRHATETYPLPFSIHDFHAIPSTVAIPELELYRLYRQSIFIKLRLSMVCQAWRILAKRYLFELVWITSFKGANALGQLLKDEEDAGMKAPQLASWWIRTIRLDGCRPGYPANLTAETWHGEADWGDLRVISKCPRLLHYRHSSSYKEKPRVCSATLYELIYPSSTFKDVSDGSDPAAVTAGGRHSLSLRLKVAPPNQEYGLTSLDWYDTQPRSLVEHLQRHHIAFSQSIAATLQHLTIRGAYVQPNITEDQVTVLNLPNLHTLSVTDDRTLLGLTKWELPALRNLCVAGHEQEAAHRFVPFLEEHGANITKLEILEFGEDFYDDDGLAQLDIDLAEMCPELTTLNFSLRRLEPWPARQSFWVRRSHPSVRHLGLFGLEGDGHQSPSAEVLVELRQTNWKENMPALETVQDMSIESHRMRRRAMEHPGSPEARLTIAFWETLVGILVDRGVTLLDWKGEPVLR